MAEDRGLVAETATETAVVQHRGKSPTLIIDCNYVCHVVRYALNGTQMHYNGRDTAIIYGFMCRLRDFLIRFSPKRVAFCWDSPNSARRALDPAYKAARHRTAQTDEELQEAASAYEQFTHIRTKLLPKLGFVNNFMADGYEGDDLIAGLVKGRMNPDHCFVVSGDNDLYQLLEWCSLYLLRKHELYTWRDFEAEYGVPPRLWTAVKALAGCPGDGVAGLPGIGVRTAVKYLKGELGFGEKRRRIEGEGGQASWRNAYPLVALPFAGTPVYKIRRDKTVTRERFASICRYYGFHSFMSPMVLRQWSVMFTA